MSFYLFVFDKPTDESVPLPAQVVMTYSDKVIPVYNYRRNILYPPISEMPENWFIISSNIDKSSIPHPYY